MSGAARLILSCLLAALAAACAPEGAPPAPAGHLDAVGADLTVDREALLRFQLDGNTVAEQLPIYAGGRLRLTYDPLRLPACRATRPDGSAWQLFARVTVTDDAGAVAPPVTVELRPAGRLHEVVWAVPETATALQVRFVTLDPDGCTETDAGPDGAGYGFEASRPSVPVPLVFGADWTEVAAAPLRAGGLLQIAYAPERLPVCRSRAYGGRAWNIIAGWRFEPGGQTGQAALFVGDFYDDDAAYQQPLVPVPEDAEAVSLWFSNSDRTGCVGWDSAFGEDYTFPIDRAVAQGPTVGWAGDVRFVIVGDRRDDRGDVDPAYYWDRWQGVPLASEIEVQAWIPGLSDQRYADDGAARAAAEAVFAVAETDAVAGDGPDGWGEVPLRFAGQRGNNFVFTWPLVGLRGAAPVPDGLYAYRFALSTDGGRTRYHVGAADGRDRRVVLAADVACGLFPDHAPAECPAARPVAWAGDVGARRGGACAWRAGIEDPVTFTKSALGSDCMVLTADVFVPGLTDAGGDPRSLVAVAEADIGYHQGPLAQPATYGLQPDGRVGNNYRYAWSLSALVGRADRGDYRYRFKFSADEGRTWFVVGAVRDDGWRALRVRNDSLDVDPEDPVQVCDDLWRFDGPGNQRPACVPYAVDAQFDANHCEVYLNALGRGQFAQAQANEGWLEAWLRVGAVEGEVLAVGLYATWTEADGAHEGWMLGVEVEPGYWRAGLLTHSNALDIDRAPQAVAFFVDVRRADGEVVRLWQSAGGANYAVDAVYAVPGYVLGIGSGSIEYADEGQALFDPKRACQR